MNSSFHLACLYGSLLMDLLFIQENIIATLMKENHELRDTCVLIFAMFG